jgi:hypothetical protein
MTIVKQRSSRPSSVKWIGTALLAAMLTSFIVVPVSADAPSKIVESAYPPGPCDSSDVLGLLGKDGLLRGAPKHATALIKARIAECKAVMAKYFAGLPTPPPTLPPIVTAWPGPVPLPALSPPTPFPTAPAACDNSSTNDPMRAYAALDYCTGWITRYVSSPPPAVSPTPQPIAVHTPPAKSSVLWNKVVYVMALASDAPTSAQVALQLTDELRTRRLARGPVPDPYAPQFNVQYNFVAQPTWTLAQYQQQCFSDPSTAGAIVALQPSTQSASYNVLFSASWTKVGLEAIVLDCEPTNTAYVNNAAYITWISDVHTNTGRRYSFALASALAVLSAIVTLHPTRSTTYTTVPPSPLPAAGTSYQTGYSSGTNQGVGLTAAAGVAALTPLASTNIGQGPGPDAQTAAAIQKDMKVLLPDLVSACTRTTPAQPFNLSPTQCQWFDASRF